jgi:hypothetical protein
MTSSTLEHREEPFVDEASDSPESLILDIGDNVGALILYADESCLGQEIDITRSGHSRSHDVHTMIRRRRAVSQEFVAGVYGELESGTYTVWGLDGEPLADIVISGGRVTEFDAGDCRRGVG